MKLVYEVHRTSRAYGGASHSTSPLDMIICSTSIRSAIFRGFIIMIEEEEEEEKKLTRLEKRLVANFDSTIKLSKCWVLIRIFTTCWDT
jgi:hypothetical protein